MARIQRPVLWASFGVLLSALTASAQPAQPGTDPTGGARQLELTTRDGVYLVAHYWIPRNVSTETPPIVLLHDLGGTQRDWFAFAQQLNQDGFAVITFDWRGHGDSKYVDPAKYLKPKEANERDRIRAASRAFAPSGELPVVPPGSRIMQQMRQESARTTEDTVDFADYRTGEDIAKFLAYDLEAVKLLLIQENNDRRLNIRRLGMVAVGAASNVALQWMSDYEYFLSRGPVTGWSRQAGDLSALVMLTPEYNYKGLSLAKNFGRGADEMPMFLITAAKGKNASDADRIARTYKLPAVRNADKRKDFYRPDSVWMEVPSNLEGMALLQPPVADLDKAIRGYLTNRLNEGRGRSWAERLMPGTGDGGFGSGR